jgi:hypothetical protein
LFPKFYADTVIATRPNSKLAKALQLAYPKILDKVKSNMATRTCTHIKASGVRCGSPALRGEFCYFHQRMHRGVRTPPQARLHPIANFEDEESIQFALMEVTNALMRNTIDLKRATLILRALHIAVKNAARVHYKFHSSDMVKEVPQYAGPTQQDAQMAYDMGLPGGLIPKVRTAAERAAEGNHQAPKNPKSREELLADYYGYPSVEAYREAEKRKNAGTAAEKKSVGADAFVRPSGAAAVAQPEQLPAHSFKNNAAQAPQHRLLDTPRKPQATAKTVTKEKMAKAQSASRGQ